MEYSAQNSRAELIFQIKFEFGIIKRMFEAFFKVWYFIAILPFLIAKEGYEKLKIFLRQNIKIDWIYVSLGILIILLLILLVLLR